MLNKQFTIMQIITSVYRYFKPRILGMIVAFLFLAIVMVSVIGTSWPTVDQLPQNLEDPSNIEGIGLLIFTQFVVPFELLSIVLLSAMIGAIYIAKGEAGK
ncbi:MAG: F420H2 dehydrogenase subunit FpoJ [Methanolobus sp.]|uniref:F420H2 dehydrogenase subunit FpoJ n=1 Tax=Methanolobus sp. TaxID=1874737 RepID=UPI00272F863E|nr:F420H2 dehydrogenase subunit FpoJ [Methanolobus sp.]MDP2217251.1 F420H2 dehydrogenase subunit FpoJ [Methanolobus sp.]